LEVAVIGLRVDPFDTNSLPPDLPDTCVDAMGDRTYSLDHDQCRLPHTGLCRPAYSAATASPILQFKDVGPLLPTPDYQQFSIWKLLRLNNSPDRSYPSTLPLLPSPNFHDEFDRSGS
jgi:hypothetical protein